VAHTHTGGEKMGETSSNQKERDITLAELANSFYVGGVRGKMVFSTKSLKEKRVIDLTSSGSLRYERREHGETELVGWDKTEGKASPFF